MKQLLFLILLFTQLNTRAELLVVTEDLPPLNFIKDNVITGHHTHVINALMTKINIEHSIVALPWARSYKTATTQPNVLIYTINHTQERHEKFHWIGEFPTKLDINYYAIKSSKFNNLTISELKKLRIGTQINTANDMFITKNGFININRVNHIDQTLDMLKQGRIDIVIASQHQIEQSSKNTGLPLSELTKVAYAFSSTPSIAVSLPTSETMVKKLRKAYSDLSRNNDMCKLMKIDKQLCKQTMARP